MHLHPENWSLGEEGGVELRVVIITMLTNYI